MQSVRIGCVYDGIIIFFLFPSFFFFFFLSKNMTVIFIFLNKTKMSDADIQWYLIVVNTQAIRKTLATITNQKKKIEN